MRRLGQGLAARGVSVVTFNFPYMESQRRAPDPAPVLEDAFGKVWNEVASSGGRAFAGGKSMGGRISSQATAAGTLTPAPAGLVFFGYPLHPPGKPSQRRDKHLPAVEPPMLFVHGTRDPFGTADEMRALIGSLSQATLHLVDEGDHSLAVPKRRDPDGRSLDTAMEVAAAWILAATAAG